MLVRAMLAALSLTTMAGCETSGGYGSRVSYYEGYYDNYYGPVRRGYWADDGYFYYRPHRHRDYIRDDAHHFRRHHSDGWRSFRVRGDRPPPNGIRPPNRFNPH